MHELVIIIRMMSINIIVMMHHVWDPAEDLQCSWDSRSENNSQPLQQKEGAPEDAGGSVEASKSPKPPPSAYLHQAAWKKRLC